MKWEILFEAQVELICFVFCVTYFEISLCGIMAVSNLFLLKDVLEIIELKVVKEFSHVNIQTRVT